MLIKDLQPGNKYEIATFNLNRAFPVTALSKQNSVQNFSVEDGTGAWIRAAHFRVTDKTDLTKYEKGTPLTLSKIVVENKEDPKDPSKSYPIILRCEVKISTNKTEITEKELKASTETKHIATSSTTYSVPGNGDDNIARQSSIKAAVKLATSDAFKEGLVNMSDILTMAELFRGYVGNVEHPEITERAKLICEIENLLAQNNFELDIKTNMLFTATVPFLKQIIEEIKK